MPATVNVSNTAAGTAGKHILFSDSGIPQTITDLLTFNRGAAAPFAVDPASLKVANLDADKIDGKDATLSLTTTSTGAQNNFNPGTLTAHINVLRCNNATALTLTGLQAGTDGQILIICAVGTGQVDIAPLNGGSLAANQFKNLSSGGVTSLAPASGTSAGGVAVYRYDATLALWVMLTHDQGSMISFATSQVGWAAGVVATVKYLLKGKQLFVWFSIVGTSNNANSTFTIPYNVADTLFFAMGRAIDNGVAGAQSGIGTTSPGSATITLFKDNVPNAWTAAGGKTVQGQFVCEV